MEEKHKLKPKHKFKFITGHERQFVWFGIIIAYALLIVLCWSIYTNMKDKIELEMKFDSEKSFNTIYLALNDSQYKALNTMKEEGVSAIGVYAADGTVYQSLGEAPTFLSLSKLSLGKGNTDSTLGVYSYSKESWEIEYFRLSRFGVMMETGTSKITPQGTLASPSLNIPEIVYIKFDGSSYFKAVLRAFVATVFAIIILTGATVLTLFMYEDNRRFRIAFAKNERLASLGTAIRTLTHEIKNPLSALTIQSALLKKTIPQEFKDDLYLMDHEIQRLTNLTNRVSEFLKNPQGEPIKIEIISFVKEIIGLFTEEIAFESEITNPVYVLFDMERARSVFENLIKNATESSKEGNPQVSVSIDLLRHRRVSIMIKDRGDGLPEGAKEKLFDPFFTTKIHGSGIGLAISRQFVHARGGSLKLKNREGGGTIAEVILPYELG